MFKTFGIIYGSNSTALKNSLKSILESNATDEEKVIEIDAILNPVPLIPINALMNNGVPITNNSSYIINTGV